MSLFKNIGLSDYQGISGLTEAESLMMESASRWILGKSLSCALELGSLSLSSFTISAKCQVSYFQIQEAQLQLLLLDKAGWKRPYNKMLQ